VSVAPDGKTARRQDGKTARRRDSVTALPLGRPLSSVLVITKDNGGVIGS
jgi:hypothetical protein